MYRYTSRYLLIAFLLIASCVQSQQNKKTGNLVYVDPQGVLRYTANDAEASFFGVNYTTPFAFAFRAHKALGVDLEKAIQQDVYHMSRMGINAFRIHIWDTEISDTVGNLLQNEHLRLFDFLLAELKKRDIKAVITPIAFWGNGYPERDEATPGFSRKYGKGRATSNDTAIRAQENYIQQFFKHVNPYTKLTYTNDPAVIAVELNNEPSHGGPKQNVTNYINRLAAALRSTGFTKPVYYNISQSPFYSDAVAKADIDGVSFQWYPTGLVANMEVKGNFLPHVNNYSIPYDTVPAYRTKSRMIYEFDAADVLQSYLYPAMAKSFRRAGFQWATQFAYDPMAIAYANTEYQTHYLNLAYTPAKAISFLIAGEVFRTVPRLKDMGTYPADSSFDAFRVSYRNNLSEMNTDQKFYYSNTTTSSPVNSLKLTAIAGVGSSPVISYNGSGAYFLDKVEDGTWRLEVMPDAISIRDPFERASPKKEVTRIEWNTQEMSVQLPDLAPGFSIKGINNGNSFTATASGNTFSVRPGTYLLFKAGKSNKNVKGNIGAIAMNEFVAPAPAAAEMFVRHEPFAEISAGKPMIIRAKIAGLDTGRASVQLTRFGGEAPQGFGGRGGGGGQRNIPMVRGAGNEYTAVVPAELLAAGVITYKIILQKGTDYTSFPGNIQGNPFAWDNYASETWKTYAAVDNGHLELFNPAVDRARVYGARRGFQSSYMPGDETGKLSLKFSATELSGDHTIGFQHFIADKLAGRISETGTLNKLVLRARTGSGGPAKVKVTLVNRDGVSHSAFVTVNNEYENIEVPLTGLTTDASLLLPRPYPDFMPLKFKASGSNQNFSLADIEKIEVTIGSELAPADFKKAYSLEVASIWLQKK